MTGTQNEEKDIDEYIEEEEDRIDSLTSIFKKPKPIDFSIDGFEEMRSKVGKKELTDFFNDDGTVLLPKTELGREETADYHYENENLKKNTKEELFLLLEREFGMTSSNYKDLGLKAYKKNIIDFIIERRLSLQQPSKTPQIYGSKRYDDVEFKGSGKSKAGRYHSYLILICGNCETTVLCGTISKQCLHCHTNYDFTTKEKQMI